MRFCALCHNHQAQSTPHLDDHTADRFLVFIVRKIAHETGVYLQRRNRQLRKVVKLRKTGAKVIQ